MIFGAPLAVWIVATITRRAPVTRSIAPPILGASLPGIIQLASRSEASTCRPSSAIISKWPPRIRPNDKMLAN